MKKAVLARVIPMLIAVFVSCGEEPDADAPLVNNIIPAQGIPGATVNIFGKNLGTQASAAVMFNGMPATIVSHSGNSIETVVPDGATSGPVSVTVGEQTGISTSDFTVLLPIAHDPGFYFGADLSYVNQVLDHGGVYRDAGIAKDPYEIFSDHGTDVVRLRLWHNPQWTREVYEPDAAHAYNDVSDVANAIGRAKAFGMKVLLDFHYSDTWADPGSQQIPAAWLDIRDVGILRDSVYDYTRKTLQHLDNKGLMPEFIQVGNEINCGMLYEFDDNAVAGFPNCNVCNSGKVNLVTVINGAIKAIRDVSAVSSVDTMILLHVADPANIQWWFDNMSGAGGVSDFDIIGFSYYPIWHTGVSLEQLSDRIAEFRDRYEKDVMILETAYPWTSSGNDSYNNLFGTQAPLPGYPYTPQGQFDMMKKITQEVIDGGGIGLVYWEPAWITSDVRDLWNTGSAWENCTFFDFNSNVLPGIDFMNTDYAQ